jgi:hypothetical protein
VYEECEQRCIPAAVGRAQEVGDLGRREVRGLLGRHPGPPDGSGGVGSQRTVTYGGVQHSSQDRVGGADRRLGEPLAAEFDDPALDV